jgi:uncharacterized protein (TIGR03000 family)
MYSIVLMMALTGGEATPAGHGCNGGCHGGGWGCNGGGHGCHGGGFGCHGGGHGCRGGWGCNGGGHGCRGGLFGGHGCRGGGLFSKHRNRCNGGCHGGYGCNGGCHGGWGCSGGGCHGGVVVGCHGGMGVGCAGGVGCQGAPVVVPAPVAPAPQGEVVPPPAKKEASLRAPATIVVTLPAEAQLVIDDYTTTSTSATRVFTSPALDLGKAYTYTLKATITRDGRPMTTNQVVAVRGGEETRVTLDFADASVAQR